MSEMQTKSLKLYSLTSYMFLPILFFFDMLAETRVIDFKPKRTK